MTRSLPLSAGFLLGADLLSKAINVLFFAFLARYLPPSDTGVYITLLSFVAFGLFFSDPGFSQSLIRDIAQRRDSTFADVNQYLVLATGFCIVAWTGMTIVATSLGFSPELLPLLLMGGLFVGFQTWAEIASAFIKARQRMGLIAAGYSISAVLFSSMGIYFVTIGLGLYELAWLLVLQGFFNFLFFWYAAIRLGLPIPNLRLRVHEALPVFKSALPVGLLIGSGVALNRLDIFMLSKMRGMEDTAMYGLAVKIIDSLSLVSGSVLAALFPYFSSNWRKSRSDVERVYGHSLKFFVILGLASAVMVSVYSPEVISLFFGNRFGGSVLSLRILIWSFLFYAIGAPLGIFILIEKERILGFLPYAIGIIALNVALNFWLIPTYSFVGASTSTLVCSILLYLLKMLYVKRFFPTKVNVLRVAVGPLLASSVMALSFWLARPVGTIFSLVIGVLSFLVSLGIFELLFAPSSPRRKREKTV